LAGLEKSGLISRDPGDPRSARVAVPVEKIPSLEAVDGAGW
jgi:hypothetical protein